MAQKENLIFLGKNGKIFGPYQKQDYDQMLSTGELKQYTWIWDWKDKTWNLLEFPPPPISDSSTVATDEIPIEVVCYNQSHILSGKLEMITETGGLFTADQPCYRLSFSSQCPVELNLFHRESKKNITIRASIQSMDYRNKHWTYCLQWRDSPKLIF